MGRRGKISIIPQCRIRISTQRLYDRIEFPCTVPFVHLRYQFRKFIGISLRQTAEYYDSLSLASFLFLYSLQDCLDRLFLRVSDESACVEKDDINGNILSLRNDLVQIFHLGKDMLCIHLVLGAAQGDSLKFPLHRIIQRLPPLPPPDSRNQEKHIS